MMLSEQAREISGVTSRTVRGDQFKRLLQLWLCVAEPAGDTNQVRAVATYFDMLGLVRAMFRGIAPSVLGWIDAERGGCTYVAAVVLDRRIAYTRMLMAQQASH